MSSTKKRLASLQKEIFFKTSECSRIYKNIQKLTEEIRGLENDQISKKTKNKNPKSRENGTIPSFISEDDIVSEFLYRPDDESSIQADTISLLSDVHYQFGRQPSDNNMFNIFDGPDDMSSVGGNISNKNNNNLGFGFHTNNDNITGAGDGGDNYLNNNDVNNNDLQNNDVIATTNNEDFINPNKGERENNEHIEGNEGQSNDRESNNIDEISCDNNNSNDTSVDDVIANNIEFNSASVPNTVANNEEKLTTAEYDEKPIIDDNSNQTITSTTIAISNETSITIKNDLHNYNDQHNNNMTNNIEDFINHHDQQKDNNDNLELALSTDGSNVLMQNNKDNGNFDDSMSNDICQLNIND